MGNRRLEIKSDKKGLIDICLLAHKRLEFTKLVFERLLKRTDFDLVEKVIIIHDCPDRENTEFFEKQIEKLRKYNIGIIYVETENEAVAPGMKLGMELSRSKYFLKIDNDLVPGERWINCLVQCMESYPELVLLGYSRIYEDGFPREKIVIKDSLNYGYLKCYDRSKKHWGNNESFKAKTDVFPYFLRTFVGGSMVLRMKVVRPVIERFDLPKRRFLGWSEFQMGHIKPLGTAGWYFPTIEGTLYLDRLGDRTLFDKAGLPFDKLCELVDKYHKKGWTKQSLAAALVQDFQKTISIEGRICSDV